MLSAGGETSRCTGDGGGPSQSDHAGLSAILEALAALAQAGRGSL